MRRLILAVAVVFIGGLSSPIRTAGQGVPVAGPGFQPEGWWTGWSPLRPMVDLYRYAPGTQLATPDLLTAPHPRSGLFWTVGNPAGLPREHEERADYRLEIGRTDGAYRRPLDPAVQERTRLTAAGTGAPGRRTSAVGRVVLDRVRHGSPALANLMAPHGSSPLMVLDTSASALESTTARVEGALGTRLGPFAVGAGVGFDAGETRSVATAVPRSIRSALPAVVLGGSWDPLGSSWVTVGIHGRWQWATHTINLLSLAAPTRVYELAGYHDPAPIDVTATFYRRDVERTARGAGAGISVGQNDRRVLLFAEVARATEEHSSAEVNNPPRDTWTATAHTLGAAVDWPSFDGRLLVHASAVRTSLDGRLSLHELDDAVVLTGDQGGLDLALVSTLDLGDWMLGLRATGEYRTRAAIDSTVGAAAEVRSWTSAVSAEVARRLPGRFSAAAAVGLLGYRPAGAVPSPDQLGPVYRAFAGTELAFDATDAMARTAVFTLSWAPRDSPASFYVQGRAATSSAAADAFPYTPPSGDRGGWSVAIGWGMP